MACPRYWLHVHPNPPLLHARNQTLAQLTLAYREGNEGIPVKPGDA